MEELTLAKVNQNSITVTRNSKGDYQWDIKAYFGDTDEEEKLALQKIKNIDVALRTGYLR